MGLEGGGKLKARLKAMGQAFKPAGRAWAEEAARLSRSRVPTGSRQHTKPAQKLKPSIVAKGATAKKARVVGAYSAYFVDAGTHYPKFKRRGAKDRPAQSMFQRSGFRVRPRPFRVWAHHEALRRHPASEAIIKLWNEAA